MKLSTTDTTLKTGSNFPDVIFEPAQTTDGAFINLLFSAKYPHGTAPGDFAFSDKDTGNLSFLPGSKNRPHFSMSVDNFHESGCQHAL